jgi:hypothetical protein
MFYLPTRIISKYIYKIIFSAKYIRIISQTKIYILPMLCHEEISSNSLNSNNNYKSIANLSLKYFLEILDCKFGSA